MDPGTALGVASLEYDVIKNLYEYYRLRQRRRRAVIPSPLARLRI